MMQDFVEVMEGTTVDGQHIHIYKQLKSDLLNIGVERARRKEDA